MKHKNHWFPVLFATLVAVPCMAQIEYNETDWGVHPMAYSRVGTAGWQFLKMPTNARTAAMAGIYSSVGYGDANSAFSNPASTADIKNWNVAFNQMNWVADIQFQSFSLVKNLKSLGTVGVNFVFVDYGEMARTINSETFDTQGNRLGVFPVISGLGTFSASDMSIGISYARQITNKLQVGGNLRYLEERLDDAKTSNYTLDIGTMYYTGLKTLRIAMLGKSFGPDAEFTKYDERIQVTPVRVKMPMLFALGAAIDVLEKRDGSPHHMILAAEYLHPNDGTDKINIGTEYAFMDMFCLRAGYKFNYDEEGLTLGGGIRYSAMGVTFNIHYAYLDVGLFKSVNLFSVGLSL